MRWLAFHAGGWTVTYRSSWDRFDSLRNSIDRLFEEWSGRRKEASPEGDQAEPQSVPVNVFETENELMVVAAMPGIEAANVDIEVEDNYLTLRANKRGPGQEHHRYLRREWSYGPYERTIELPLDVDVGRANAAYGNGIVTIALPKAPRKPARRIEITLDASGTARGEHIGHRGTVEAGGGTETGPKGDREQPLDPRSPRT
jgi:HSP20 family protein